MLAHAANHGILHEYVIKTSCQEFTLGNKQYAGTAFVDWMGEVPGYEQLTLTNPDGETIEPIIIPVFSKARAILYSNAYHILTDRGIEMTVMEVSSTVS